MPPSTSDTVVHALASGCLLYSSRDRGWSPPVESTGGAGLRMIHVAEWGSLVPVSAVDGPEWHCGSFSIVNIVSSSCTLCVPQ